MGNGFVGAKDLKPGDQILLLECITGTVEEAFKEELTEPVKVYNFEVKDYHTYFVGEQGVLVHNSCKGSKKLLPGEGDIGTYNDLIKAGKRGDNLTPHHMPSAEYMLKKGVARSDGLCMNMEMPVPGSGGRHRLTDTYGSNMTDAEKAFYYSLSPRDALAYDIKNLRKIYQNDGLYEEIRPKLIQYIKTVIATNPELFDK